MNQLKFLKTSQLIRTSLRQILYFPVKFSQLTGSFVFRLESNAEITFSWVALPVILLFVKIPLGLISITLFWKHKEEYQAIFGNWADIDLFTYSLVTLLSFGCDILSSFMILKNKERIQEFHKQLVNFIVDIHTENAVTFPKALESSLKTLTNAKKKAIAFTLYTISNGCFSYFFAIWGSEVAGNVLNASSFITGTAPTILLFFVLINTFRQSQYYVVGGVLSYISFALKGLNYCRKWSLSPHRRDEKQLLKLLQNFKLASHMIKQANDILQWAILTGVLSLLVNTLCFLFQLCSWIPFMGLAIPAASLGPEVIGNLLVLYYLSSSACDIYKQSMEFVVSLRDIGSFNWVIANKELCRKVTMYHIAGLADPLGVIPGHFFTLHPNILPSLIAVCITYLLVLIQFQLKDEKLHTRGVLLWEILGNKTFA